MDDDPARKQKKKASTRPPTAQNQTHTPRSRTLTVRGGGWGCSWCSRRRVRRVGCVLRRIGLRVSRARCLIGLGLSCGGCLARCARVSARRAVRRLGRLVVRLGGRVRGRGRWLLVIGLGRVVGRRRGRSTVAVVVSLRHCSYQRSHYRQRSRRRKKKQKKKPDTHTWSQQLAPCALSRDRAYRRMWCQWRRQQPQPGTSRSRWPPPQPVSGCRWPRSRPGSPRSRPGLSDRQRRSLPYITHTERHISSVTSHNYTCRYTPRRITIT